MGLRDNYWNVDLSGTGTMKLNTFVCYELSYTDLSSKFIAGSLDSANSSILAACRHFKEVLGKKIRILL